MAHVSSIAAPLDTFGHGSKQKTEIHAVRLTHGGSPGLFNLWGCDPFRLIFMEVISVLISPSRAKLGRVEKRAFSEFLGEGSVRVLQRLRRFPSAGPLPDEASPVDPPQTSFGEGEVKKLRKTNRASTPKIEQPRVAPSSGGPSRSGAPSRPPLLVGFSPNNMIRWPPIH
ncbi:hypothetical protein CA85_25620 [Allorhodopirellula solitaria]|uniref:Uncharacterized protein n=1 Tax=Allorhodopirellula solitaria TaxID=2527987 RepID=A0A5C5XT88_9BACT|nr:hypothetical protein CA85_25620 [Allorhodopirellula solitaria]